MPDVSPLDGPPIEDGLAAAFELPQAIQDSARMLNLHSEVVSRLRREAAGLPMNTVQLLLLERIATFYVQVKMRELEGVAVRELRELNSFWLSMTQEFNRLLTASQDKLREQLFTDIQAILNDAIKENVTDQDVRKNLRRTLAENFASLDL
jgi:hypothetical protein